MTSLVVPERVAAVLKSIRYLNWDFHIRQLTEEVTQVAVVLPTRCVVTGVPAMMSCGDRMISNTMTEDEILRSVLAMILAAHEHEAREHFMYNGKRIFDPHKSLNAA